MKATEQHQRLLGIYSAHVELAHFAVKYYTLLGIAVFVSNNKSENHRAVLEYLLRQEEKLIFDTKWYVEFEGIWQTTRFISQVEVISVTAMRKAPPFVGLIL